MSDLAEKIQETIPAPSESPLNGMIAIFVALVATFMAVSNVKDGNVAQAMQQAQAKSIDQWAYYQAKATKQNIAENTADIFSMQLALAGELSPEARAKVESGIERQKQLAKKYEEEKGAIRQEAEQAGQEYNALNVHDDQFDLADACLSVSVALAGITALTRKPWLFGVAVIFALIGLVYGMAGFMHWQLHSDFMARLLG